MAAAVVQRIHAKVFPAKTDPQGFYGKADVMEVFILQEPPAWPKNPSRPSDPERAWKAAAAKCGSRIASASWGLYVWFPTGANIFTSGYLFFAARTKQGWAVYYARNIS